MKKLLKLSNYINKKGLLYESIMICDLIKKEASVNKRYIKAWTSSPTPPIADKSDPNSVGRVDFGHVKKDHRTGGVGGIVYGSGMYTVYNLKGKIDPSQTVSPMGESGTAKYGEHVYGLITSTKNVISFNAKQANTIYNIPLDTPIKQRILMQIKAIGFPIAAYQKAMAILESLPDKEGVFNGNFVRALMPVLAPEGNYPNICRGVIFRGSHDGYVFVLYDVNDYVFTEYINKREGGITFDDEKNIFKIKTKKFIVPIAETDWKEFKVTENKEERIPLSIVVKKLDRDITKNTRVIDLSSQDSKVVNVEQRRKFSDFLDSMFDEYIKNSTYEVMVDYSIEFIQALFDFYKKKRQLRDESVPGLLNMLDGFIKNIFSKMFATNNTQIISELIVRSKKFGTLFLQDILLNPLNDVVSYLDISNSLTRNIFNFIKEDNSNFHHVFAKKIILNYIRKNNIEKLDDIKGYIEKNLLIDYETYKYFLGDYLNRVRILERAENTWEIEGYMERYNDKSFDDKVYLVTKDPFVLFSVINGYSKDKGKAKFIESEIKRKSGNAIIESLKNNKLDYVTSNAASILDLESSDLLEALYNYLKSNPTEEEARRVLTFFIPIARNEKSAKFWARFFFNFNEEGFDAFHNVYKNAYNNPFSDVEIYLQLYKMNKEICKVAINKYYEYLDKGFFKNILFTLSGEAPDDFNKYLQSKNLRVEAKQIKEILEASNSKEEFYKYMREDIYFDNVFKFAKEILEIKGEEYLLYIFQKEFEKYGLDFAAKDGQGPFRRVLQIKDVISQETKNKIIKIFLDYFSKDIKGVIIAKEQGRVEPWFTKKSKDEFYNTLNEIKDKLTNEEFYYYEDFNILYNYEGINKENNPNFINLENKTVVDNLLSSLDIFHSNMNPFYVILKTILTSNSCDDLYNKMKDGAFFGALLKVASLYYAPVGIVVSAVDLKKAVDSGNKLEMLLAALGLTLNTFKVKMNNIKNATKQGDSINRIQAEKLLLEEVKTLNALPDSQMQDNLIELLRSSEVTFSE